MESLTIWHGAIKPMRAKGVNQCRVLSFAERFKGWHYFADDKPTRRAIAALLKKGHLEQNESGQFRFTYPKES